MPWSIFKSNVQRIADNPQNIDDIDQIADLYANEYDAAIRRGYDTINGVTIAQGNVESMKQLFKLALETGRNNDDSYDLVGEMGKGVLAYWSGATMNPFPVPTIPAPGSTSNITVLSNMVINPGMWTGTMTINIPNEVSTDVLLSEALTTTSEETNRQLADNQGVSALMDDYFNEEPSNTQLVLEAAFPTDTPVNPSPEASVDTNADAISPVFIENNYEASFFGESPTPPLGQVDPITGEWVFPLEPLGGAEFTTEVADIVIYETDEPIYTNDIAVQTILPKTVNLSTGALAYDTAISARFRLRDLTIGTILAKTAIIPQLGVTADDIVANLQNLSVNIVEPLKTHVPKMQINQGFRLFIKGAHLNIYQQDIMSQHYAGEAVDIQVPGYTPQDYTNLALWVQKNLPFDQLILEHGKTNWLHISCVRKVSKITHKGNRKEVWSSIPLMAGTFTAGIKNQYS